MTFIDRQMAERLDRKWRKEHPEEADRLDNMTREELNEFLKSKGFQFEKVKETTKK